MRRTKMINFKKRGYYEGLSYMGLVNKRKRRFSNNMIEEYAPFVTKNTYEQWYETQRLYGRN